MSGGTGTSYVDITAWGGLDYSLQSRNFMGYSDLSDRRYHIFRESNEDYTVGGKYFWEACHATNSLTFLENQVKERTELKNDKPANKVLPYMSEYYPVFLMTEDTGETSKIPEFYEDYPIVVSDTKYENGLNEEYHTIIKIWEDGQHDIKLVPKDAPHKINADIPFIKVYLVSCVDWGKDLPFDWEDYDEQLFGTDTGLMVDCSLMKQIFTLSDDKFEYDPKSGTITLDYEVAQDLKEALYNQIAKDGSEYTVFIALEVFVTKYTSIGKLASQVGEEQAQKISAMQAIQASVLEYAYQFQLAIETQQKLNEIAYTVAVTVIGTAITSPIMGTYKQIIKNCIKESLEEVFLDPLIEATVSGITRGFTDDQYIEMMATTLAESGREGYSTSVRVKNALRNRYTQKALGKLDSQIAQEVNQELGTIEEIKNEAENKFLGHVGLTSAFMFGKAIQKAALCGMYKGYAAHLMGGMGLIDLSKVSKLPPKELFEALIGKKPVEDCFRNTMKGNIGNLGEDPYEGLFGAWDAPIDRVYDSQSILGASITDVIEITSLFEIADSKKPKPSGNMFKITAFSTIGPRAKDFRLEVNKDDLVVTMMEKVSKLSGLTTHDFVLSAGETMDPNAPRNFMSKDNGENIRENSEELNLNQLFENSLLKFLSLVEELKTYMAIADPIPTQISRRFFYSSSVHKDIVRVLSKKESSIGSKRMKKVEDSLIEHLTDVEWTSISPLFNEFKTACETLSNFLKENNPRDYSGSITTLRDRFNSMPPTSHPRSKLIFIIKATIERYIGGSISDGDLNAILFPDKTVTSARTKDNWLLHKFLSTTNKDRDKINLLTLWSLLYYIQELENLNDLSTIELLSLKTDLYFEIKEFAFRAGLIYDRTFSLEYDLLYYMWYSYNKHHGPPKQGWMHSLKEVSLGVVGSESLKLTLLQGHRISAPTLGDIQQFFTDLNLQSPSDYKQNFIDMVKIFRKGTIAPSKKASKSFQGTLPKAAHLDILDVLDNNEMRLFAYLQSQHNQPDFPSHVANFEDLNTRMSSFSHKPGALRAKYIRGSGIKVGKGTSDDQRIFLQDWFDLVIRKHTKTNIPGFSYGVPSEIAMLSDLASDALEAARKTSDYDPQKNHEYVCDYIREKVDKVIGTEMPVYIFTGRGYLTGHIDIIMLVGNDLYIADFKPGEMVNSRTFITSPFDLKLSDSDLKEVIRGENLIKSVPQISSYAIALIDMLDLDLNTINVRCAAFNEQYQMVFDPIPILKEILAFVQSSNYAHTPNWVHYKDILGI
jgi:hypothetical protein